MLAYLLLSMVEVGLCCNGGGVTKPNNTNQTSGYVKFVDKQAESAWGAFDVPDEIVEKWRNWFQTYTNQTLGKGLEEQPDKPSSGWPDSWSGLGPGHAGFPPEERPPWAFVIKNTGLPSFCYQPLAKGACNKNLTRYAYNAYEDKCITFIYTGCKGNENQFRSLEKCHKWCMTKPTSPCDWQTDISRESTLFDTRRRSHYENMTRKCGY